MDVAQHAEEQNMISSLGAAFPKKNRERKSKNCKNKGT
jgi:hypothetical protein